MDFDDNKYHMFILNDWDTTELDVFVFPAAAIGTQARTTAILQSIDSWETGIDTYGAPWLRENLTINTYLVGGASAPMAAMQDPEILVVSGEVNPFVLFGIGASWDFVVCGIVEEFAKAIRAPAPIGLDTSGPLPSRWHQHEGSNWAVTRMACRDGTENRCLVVNTNFAFNSRGNYNMYDLNAHEVGHCLGIGHVGDALDFKATTFPREDIMSYQSTPNQVHCVSTLNVRGIEGTFARIAGRPSADWLVSGDHVHMDPRDYAQVACTNPLQRN